MNQITIAVHQSHLIVGLLVFCYLLNLFIVRRTYSSSKFDSLYEQEMAEMLCMMSFVLSPVFLVVVYPLMGFCWVINKLVLGGLK